MVCCLLNPALMLLPAFSPLKSYFTTPLRRGGGSYACQVPGRAGLAGLAPAGGDPTLRATTRAASTAGPPLPEMPRAGTKPLPDLTSTGAGAATPAGLLNQERLLALLVGATFLIFFQLYMVAPLIPRLALAFRVSEQYMGLMVPAYLIPYGVATLFYGLLSDHIGPRVIILSSLLAFVVLTALTTTAASADAFIGWRLVTGLGASGVVPIALALVGRLFPYEQRGRPLGWLFGAMAGGSAFGSTLGVVLEPLVGWRALFGGVATLSVLVLGGLLWVYRPAVSSTPGGTLTLAKVGWGYQQLLASARGRRTYGYVFVNAIFHAGVFTWLGVYFKQRYGLSEINIGLALLGYGLPGFFLGPIIGRWADRWGRRWLLPLGFTLAALAALGLVSALPLSLAVVAVTVLSLGYDLTQPLLAGIVTDVSPPQRGQAMGLNVFALFVGFGVGSYLFGYALSVGGLSGALLLFGTGQLLVALSGIRAFQSETNTG